MFNALHKHVNCWLLHRLYVCHCKAPLQYLFQRIFICSTLHLHYKMLISGMTDMISIHSFFPAYQSAHRLFIHVRYVEGGLCIVFKKMWKVCIYLLQDTVLPSLQNVCKLLHCVVFTFFLFSINRK